MKKVTSLLVLLTALTVSAGAQQTSAPTFSLPGGVINGTAQVEAAAYGLPAYAMPQSRSFAPLALDTLDDHFKRTTKFMIYSYRDANNNTLPVIGSNGLYLFIGQKFPISGSARVPGVLIAVAISRPAVTPDTLRAIIWPADPATGLPNGQLAGSGRFMTDGVDTSTVSQVFTYVEMEAPTDVSGPFVAVVQTRRGAASGDDLFVIWSNQHGDGKGQNRACFLVPNAQGQLTVGNLGSIINTGGTPIDLDIMILPVVDGNVSGTDRPAPSFDGLTLLETYPQPSQGSFFARFSAKQAMSVTLDVIDPAGRLIGQSTSHELVPGVNTVPVSIPQGAIAAGRYFLRISNGATSFATPVLISGN